MMLRYPLNKRKCRYLDIVNRMELLLAELSYENKELLFTEIEIASALEGATLRSQVSVVAQMEEEL